MCVMFLWVLCDNDYDEDTGLGYMNDNATAWSWRLEFARSFAQQF